MQPSMPDLTYLSLKHFAFGENDLVSFLSLLPSLQILRIHEQPLDGDPLSYCERGLLPRIDDSAGRFLREYGR